MCGRMCGNVSNKITPNGINNLSLYLIQISILVYIHTMFFWFSSSFDVVL